MSNQRLNNLAIIEKHVVANLDYTSFKNLHLDNGATVKLVAHFESPITSLTYHYYPSSFNPDNDSFWLVETGRWIIENKQFPKFNPWEPVPPIIATFIL